MGNVCAGLGQLAFTVFSTGRTNRNDATETSPSHPSKEKPLGPAMPSRGGLILELTQNKAGATSMVGESGGNAAVFRGAAPACANHESGPLTQSGACSRPGALDTTPLLSSQHRMQPGL